MHGWIRLIILLILSTPAASAGQTSGDDVEEDPRARQVMLNLRENFDESGGFSGRFRQRLDADYAEAPNTVSGTIILSGDRYRIETGDQTIVTDGMTTWVYVSADQQVIIDHAVEDDEGSFTPGYFLDERADRYAVSFADEQEPGKYVIVLKAKSPDTYLEQATLWISRDDLTISRIDVVDVNGAEIQFEMSDIVLSPAIGDSTFTFYPGEDIEVVDLR